MPGPLDAVFGQVYNNGIPVELGGGIDFRDGIDAAFNPSTGRVEITFEDSTASLISYDNSTSGLAATTVQDAIDEVLGLGTETWAEVLANGATSGGTSPRISSGDGLEVEGDSVAKLIGGTVAGGTDGLAEVSRVGGGASGFAARDGAALAKFAAIAASGLIMGAVAGNLSVLANNAEVLNGSSTATVVKGALTSSSVELQKSDGTVFLKVNPAANRVDVPIGEFHVGSSTGAATVTASGAGASATVWAFNIGGSNKLDIGDTSIPVGMRYYATSSGSGAGIDGHTFYVGGTARAQINETNFFLYGITLSSSGNPIAMGDELRMPNSKGALWERGAGGGIYLNGLTINAFDDLVVGQTTAVRNVFIEAGTGDVNLRSGGTLLVGATTSLVSHAVPISVTSGGAAVAGTGVIRRPNNEADYWRNAANTANWRGVFLGADDVGRFGDGSANVNVIGDTSVGFVAGGSAKAFVSATALQVINGVKFDTASGTAALSIGGTNWMTGTVALTTVVGNLAVGSGTVAGTGALRFGNNKGQYSRNAGNTANVRVAIVDGSDNIVFGDNSVAGANTFVFGNTTVHMRAGGADTGIWRTTELELQSGIKLDWASGTAALSIGGTNWMTSDGTRVDVIASALGIPVSGIRATAGTIQLATGATVYGRNNGNTNNVRVVWLKTSDEVALGDPTFSPSVQLIASTTLKGILGASDIWITRTDRFELQSGIKLDWASGTAALSIGGTDWMNATSSLIESKVPLIRFAANVSSPAYSQAPETTTSNAQSLFVSAQANSNGTSGNGGDLYLSGGTSTAGTAGGVRLRTGTTTRLQVDATGIGVFAATPVAKQTVTGSRGGNAALASFLTAMAAYGWITDSTTA